MKIYGKHALWIVLNRNIFLGFLGTAMIDLPQIAQDESFNKKRKNPIGVLLSFIQNT